MRRITSVLILVLIAITVAIVIPYSRKENSSNTTMTTIKYCRVNEDCVSAQCCHSTDCVDIGNKPDCKGIMCTMECRPGTMDCGQGHCACVNNECKAIIG